MLIIDWGKNQRDAFGHQYTPGSPGTWETGGVGGGGLQGGGTGKFHITVNFYSKKEVNKLYCFWVSKQTLREDKQMCICLHMKDSAKIKIIKHKRYLYSNSILKKYL